MVCCTYIDGEMGELLTRKVPSKKRAAGEKKPANQDNSAPVLAVLFSSPVEQRPAPAKRSAAEAERQGVEARAAGLGGLRTEGDAPKRRRVSQGLVLPRKFVELSSMFDAVATVADLRMRRGEPPLFTKIVAAAANVYGKTANDADFGKNITGDHIRQMQKVASDMIRFVPSAGGRSSSIEVLRPLTDGPQRMNPMAMQSRRSREFRKRLLRITRRHYQRFLNGLPTDKRPDHDSASAVFWDPRFNPDSIPDVPLAGAPAAAPAAAARTAVPPSPAAARLTPVPTPATVSCSVGTPELVTPEPMDIRCTAGDAIEVQYGPTWYPAVVSEMQGSHMLGHPPRKPLPLLSVCQRPQFRR